MNTLQDIAGTRNCSQHVTNLALHHMMMGRLRCVRADNYLNSKGKTILEYPHGWRCGLGEITRQRNLAE